jgi:hypothetical protein
MNEISTSYVEQVEQRWLHSQPGVAAMFVEFACSPPSGEFGQDPAPLEAAVPVER